MSNITKKRKRSAEEAAEKARDRAIRNRISAQESRDRQKKYIKDLEESNDILKEQNETLLSRLSAIEEQNRLLMEKLDSLTQPSTVLPATPLSMDNVSTLDASVLDTLSPTLSSPMFDSQTVEEFFAQFQSEAPTCSVTPIESTKAFESLFPSQPPIEVSYCTLVEKPFELKSDPAVVQTSQQQMNSLSSSTCLASKSSAPTTLLASCSPLDSKPERKIRLNISRWNEFLKKQYPLCFAILNRPV
jgi:hypothetical protein